MSDEQKNVCDFKKCCKECTFTLLEERPGKCQTLDCPEYKPCPECGNNNHLNDKGRCVKCQHNKHEKTIEARRKEHLARIQQAREKAAGIEQEVQRQLPEDRKETDADRQPERRFSHTQPGIPPKEMTQEEREFYLQRWEEYTGYYHNPSAKFAVHAIILEEMWISELISVGLTLRGARMEDNVRARETAYKMLDTLKRQLPDKEADDSSDQEKSMAVIYEKYCEEKGRRWLGNGVSRILSPEAIALAPVLTHPLDPKELIEGCGFKTININEFVKRYELTPQTEDDISLSPEQYIDKVMEFFGFRLKEEYAMEFKTLGADEEADYVPEGEE